MPLEVHEVWIGLLLAERKRRGLLGNNDKDENSGSSGGRMEQRESGGGIVNPFQVEAVWLSPSISHSIIPTHIFTLSSAFTCAKVFPPGARLQFRG